MSSFYSVTPCCSRTTISDECCKCKYGSNYSLVKKTNGAGYKYKSCENNYEPETQEWNKCFSNGGPIDEFIKLLDDSGCMTDAYLSSHTKSIDSAVKYSVAVSRSPAFIWSGYGACDYTAPSGDKTHSQAWGYLTNEVDTLNDCVKNKALKNYSGISSLANSAREKVLYEMGAGTTFGLENCSDVPDYSYEACEQERAAMIDINCYSRGYSSYKVQHNYYVNVQGMLELYLSALSRDSAICIGTSGSSGSACKCTPYYCSKACCEEAGGQWKGGSGKNATSCMLR